MIAVGYEAGHFFSLQNTFTYGKHLLSVSDILWEKKKIKIDIKIEFKILLKYNLKFC